MLIQFLVFPNVARRYGVLNCLKIVTVIFPVVYVLTPFTALLSSPLKQQIGMFAIMFMKCWASIFAFPCTTILLTNSASSLRILGTLNGVSTSVSALGRATGPAVGGLTFSLGVDKGYLIMPWWTLAAFAVLGALPVWWLVESDGFGGGNDEGFENEGDTSSLRDGLLRSKPVDSEISSSNEPSEDENLATGGTTGFVKKLCKAGSSSHAHPTDATIKTHAESYGHERNNWPGGVDSSSGEGHSHTYLGSVSTATADYREAI